MPDSVAVVNRNVKLSRRNAHIGMARGVTHLGQCSTTGQCVAYECVAAVVDGKKGESLEEKVFAGCTESLASRMAG